MDNEYAEGLAADMRKAAKEVCEQLGGLALTVQEQGRELRAVLGDADQAAIMAAVNRQHQRRAWAGQFATALLRAVARELLTDQDEDRVSAAVTRLMERAWEAAGILEIVADAEGGPAAGDVDGVDLGAPFPQGPAGREVKVEGGEP